MLSASQIARFLNQLFLQNKLMKQPHFLHVDTAPKNLNVDPKIFVCAWSKIDCIKNKQMELTDFLHADTNSRKLKGD